MTPLPNGKAKFAVFGSNADNIFAGLPKGVVEDSKEYSSIEECSIDAVKRAIEEVKKSPRQVDTITINYKALDGSYLDAIKIDIGRFNKREPINFKKMFCDFFGLRRKDD